MNDEIRDLSPHWEIPEVRRRLATRDIGFVYRHLGRHGVTQRVIAELTQQNQSEVCGISTGKHPVRSYEVLERIAEGLGIPRGLMGLAYSDTDHQPAVRRAPETQDEETMRRRAMLGIAGKMMLGAPLLGSEKALFDQASRAVPAPNLVGGTDVAQLRAVTASLRAHDLVHGGVAIRSVILAHAEWATSLLSARCSEETRPELLSAIAEIKTLAGWTAHDHGLSMSDEARRLLLQAVGFTQSADNPAHTAIVMHHLGRVPLDNGQPDEALKYFKLGRIAAENAESGLAVAFLAADEAIAHADMGKPRLATDTLARALDDFAAAEAGERTTPYTRFFDQVAMRTAAARVHTRLGMTDPGQRAIAIDGLTRTLTGIPPEHARQQAFNQALLASCHLADGETATAVEMGHTVLHQVRRVKSQRLRGQLGLLRRQALALTGHSGAQDLAREIADFCATPA
ncbi:MULTISPECIES: tol-pal system YbgF family protein [Actinosynnema]|uniref:tetratricopeptide repeat protein n=1 Tax=Actinosynnema TaxID=40566 RepID=UPI0020A24D1C|nr:hypothetical protein [Actinosynnema pretiosum]MCP2097427.1 hypothetical protein [Actinosynnema pretiosum]